MIKSGSSKVDASITDSPLKPKGKPEYEVAEDRKEDERDNVQKQKEQSSQQLIRKEKPGVDSEARWLKKAGKLHYGYKKHVAVDDEGMAESVHTA